MKNLFLFLIAAIVLLSCSKNEKVIDSTEQDWQVLAAYGESGNYDMRLIEFPDGNIVQDNVYEENNDSKIQGKITKIEEFQNNLYVLVPEEYKIYVLGKITFEEIAVMDFSGDMLEPTDIGFMRNSTAAYVAHNNDSVVSLIDITTFEVARQIKTGLNPSAVECAGNLVFVANERDYNVAVIDSRTNEIIKKIQVFPVPKYIDVSPDGGTVIVVSVGLGKIDDWPDKTDAMVNFIDAEELERVQNTILSFGNVGGKQFIPQDILVSPGGFAYIPGQEIFVRVDLRIRDRVTFVARQNFVELNYHPGMQKIIGLRQANGGYTISSFEQLSGEPLSDHTISMPVTAIHAYE